MSSGLLLSIPNAVWQWIQLPLLLFFHVMPISIKCWLSPFILWFWTIGFRFDFKKKDDKPSQQFRLCFSHSDYFSVFFLGFSLHPWLMVRVPRVFHDPTSTVCLVNVLDFATICQYNCSCSSSILPMHPPLMLRIPSLRVLYAHWSCGFQCSQIASNWSWDEISTAMSSSEVCFCCPFAHLSCRKQRDKQHPHCLFNLI